MRQPLRIFEGTQKPFTPFWNWTVNQSTQEPELELYGVISEYSWFEDEVTPRQFKNDLYKQGDGGPVTVRLNSPGGDMIAGAAIASMINEYPGFVTVYIEGIAASAATTVAIAGNRVLMHESAFFMIHDPAVVFFFSAVNIEEMERLTTQLKAAKEGIIDGYQTKTGLSRAVIDHMMTDETWMSADEAKEKRFVDAVIKNGDSYRNSQNVEKSGRVAMINALRNYKNVPLALSGLFGRPGGVPEAENDLSTPDPALERLRAMAKIWK